MIRRGDQDGIHILALQHATEVLDGVRRLAALVLTDGHALGERVVIDIANDRALHFRVQEETFQIPLPHPAAADDTDADFVIGPGFARPGHPDERSAERARRQTGQSGFAEEVSPRNLLHSLK